jgi:hypothetical protein
MTRPFLLFAKGVVSQFFNFVVKTGRRQNYHRGISMFWFVRGIVWYDSAIPIICQGISVRRPSTKKQLAIFGIWDLNPRPKCRLQSSRHSTTSPSPPATAIYIIYQPACNFCPDQVGCVRLPRPVRVHRLPRKLGLRAAAPIVRVERGRGVG